MECNRSHRLSMDYNKDISMLSDELKPRRTPVPSSFENMIPRPTVPDLSIIETQTNMPTVPNELGTQSHPYLNHLSYNDWRQKTGNGPSKSLTPHLSGETQPMPQLSYNSVGSIASPHRIIASDHHQDKVSASVPRMPLQPVGKVTTYSDFKSRPTSAPDARSQHCNSAREHPLSKSEPPKRSTNCNEVHVPLQEPSRFRSISSHPGNSFPYPQSQPHHSVTNENEPSFRKHTFSDSRSSNSTGFSPKDNRHPQRTERRGRVNSIPESRGAELAIIPRGRMDSHMPCSCNDCQSPPHPLAISSKSVEDSSCGSHCCQVPLQKIHSTIPCSRHTCCSPSTNMGPHGSAHSVHPLSTFAVQNSYPPNHVSNDDLYKLVLAQNDQLKALQTQVEQLLLTQRECQAVRRKPEIVREVETVTAPVAKVSEEGTQTSDSELQEDGCEKMSIGVMTSFIHAVAYRGRVGRLDAMHNVSGHDSKFPNGKQSRSESSDDSSSLSASPTSSNSHQKSTNNCCKECVSCEKVVEKTRKHVSKNEKLKQTGPNSREESSRPRMLPNGDSSCSDVCNCNNPGVSAAISAVRGCQAVLERKAGVGMHDFSTFNGADLPTVTEQPMSPMNSIHVDLHDYHSSSSDESDSSQSDGSAVSDEDTNTTTENKPGPKHNGWTFYNNVLGQVNKILEERDLSGPTSPSSTDPQQVETVPSHKRTDISVLKRVAFEGNGESEAPKNLKELALKYLKENYPEELASGAAAPKSRKSSKDKPQEMTVYNPPASNMSFATFRYLERYNLLPENFNPQQYLEAAANFQVFRGKNGNPHEPQSSFIEKNLHKGGRKIPKLPTAKSRVKHNHPQVDRAVESHQLIQHISNGHSNPVDAHPAVHHNPTRKQSKPNTPTSKILDITTLRQQPKLL